MVGLGQIVGKVIWQRGKPLKARGRIRACSAPGLWACPQQPRQVLQRSAWSFGPTLLLASAGSVCNVVVVVLVIAAAVSLPAEPERPCIFCPIWVCWDLWPVGRTWSATHLVVALRPLPKLHVNQASGSKQSLDGNEGVSSALIDKLLVFVPWTEVGNSLMWPLLCKLTTKISPPR